MRIKIMIGLFVGFGLLVGCEEGTNTVVKKSSKYSGLEGMVSDLKDSELTGMAKNLEISKLREVVVNLEGSKLRKLVENVKGSKIKEVVENLEGSKLREVFENVEDSELKQVVKNLEDSKLKQVVKNLEDSELKQVVKNLEDSELKQVVKNLEDSELKQVVKNLEDSELKQVVKNLEDSESTESMGVVEVFAGGDGSEEDPYQIGSADQFGSITMNKNNLKKSYKLTKDLDFKEVKNFEPMGNRHIKFTGTFDGNGKVIKNVKIDQPENDVGFFGFIDKDAVVKNVILKDMNVRGHINVGGLAGKNLGTIENSYVEGEIEGLAPGVGGLVGMNYGKIKGSHMKGKVKGTTSVGGIAGHNFVYGTIENSYMEGDVTGKGEKVGGLVGYNYANIKGSHMKGKVKGDKEVGGLVGMTGGKIENSYATGDVEARESVGGIAGMSFGKIWSSHATGNVKGTKYVGGLVGVLLMPVEIADEKIDEQHKKYGNFDIDRIDAEDNENIRKSYATGDVEGEKVVGGLVGWNYKVTIKNSYATGDVTGTGGNDHWIGGFVGWNYGRIQDSYATGNVLAKGNIIGGFVGLNIDVIKRSYSTGKVEGGNNVGGLVGWHGAVNLDKSEGEMGKDLKFIKDEKELNMGGTGGKILNSYAAGNVEGKQTIGGLVGYVNDGKIKMSYATGDVEGNGGVGGFVGWHFKGKILGNNYWQLGGSVDKGFGKGLGGDVEGKVEGKKEEDLKGLNAESTSWDAAIWDFKAGEYPKLKPVSFKPQAF